MKKYLLLIALSTFIGGCSVAETQHSSLDKGAEATAKFRVREFSAPDEFFTVTEDGIDPNNDWRKLIGQRWNRKAYNEGRYIFAPSGKRSIKYYTDASGREYWFNYTAFDHRPDIWYEIVVGEKVLQTGWSTVRITMNSFCFPDTKPGDYSGSSLELIEFDVHFSKDTQLENKVLVVGLHYKKATFLQLGSKVPGYDVYNISIEEGKGKLSITDGHQPGEVVVFQPIVVDPNNDWRKLIGQRWNRKEYNEGRYIFAPSGKRSIKYYTDASGREYWFNYTAFDHRPDVWYEIMAGEKVLQTGWSTVRITMNSFCFPDAKPGDYSGAPLELLEFDVSFRKETQLKNKVLVVGLHYKKATFLQLGDKVPGYDVYNISIEEGKGKFSITEGHYPIGPPAQIEKPEHTLTINSITSKDWRSNPARKTYRSTWNLFLVGGKKGRFHYDSNNKGEKYWFDFTFFDHRKDVWYQIVLGNQIIQKGWTTVDLRTHRINNKNYVRVVFDVDFHPYTRMAKSLMVYDNAYYNGRGSLLFDTENNWGNGFGNGSFYIWDNHQSGALY
ncbi:MAG: hypothetical protein ACRC0X_00015 [Brevinema sp.]